MQGIQLLFNTLVIQNPFKNPSWFMDQIRSFFAGLDGIIYNFISILYNLMIDLSNAEIFNNEAIKSMMINVYSLLGIFMLFKVTFSVITYIISPDQFSDKTKGVQQLIKRVILTLVFIIITPWAFNFAKEAQQAIIEDQIIPKIIFGEVTDGTNTTENLPIIFSDLCCKETASDGTCSTYDAVYAKGDGAYIALTVLRPFFQLNEGIDVTKDIPVNYCTASPYGIDTYNYLRGATVMMESDKINDYSVQYHWFLSTAIGILVCLIFISFCFDIAVRTIKLGFLQIIAPIPIVSYIDPASGKDGMFKKWLKSVAVTWASLFVRLFAVFFAIYVIQLVGDINTTSTLNGEDFKSEMPFIFLFIILGALIFAKQLPKLITEITGIKLDGSFELNPFKKVSKEAVGGKLISGTTLGTVGATIGLGDSMIHGKGLREKLSGAGKGWSAAYKTGQNGELKGLLSAPAVGIEQRKKVREEKLTGKREISENKDKLNMGYEKYKQLAENKTWDSEKKEYKVDESQAFSHEDFRESFTNIGNQKKILGTVTTNAQAEQSEYSALLTRGKLDNQTEKQWEDEKDRQLKKLNSANKEVKDAEGLLEFYNKNHESLRKIYRKDAEMEDAIKFFKKAQPDKLNELMTGPNSLREESSTTSPTPPTPPPASTRNTSSVNNSTNVPLSSDGNSWQVTPSGIRVPRDRKNNK